MELEEIIESLPVINDLDSKQKKHGNEISIVSQRNYFWHCATTEKIEILLFGKGLYYGGKGNAYGHRLHFLAVASL